LLTCGASYDFDGQRAGRVAVLPRWWRAAAGGRAPGRSPFRISSRPPADSLGRPGNAMNRATPGRFRLLRRPPQGAPW